MALICPAGHDFCFPSTLVFPQSDCDSLSFMVHLTQHWQGRWWGMGGEDRVLICLTSSLHPMVLSYCMLSLWLHWDPSSTAPALSESLLPPIHHSLGLLLWFNAAYSSIISPLKPQACKCSNGPIHTLPTYSLFTAEEYFHAFLINPCIFKFTVFNLNSLKYLYERQRQRQRSTNCWFIL